MNIGMTPFFSVIIPTYNREKFIGKAIQSVLNQTFADFEIIVVDDGSADNTADVVYGFHDERVIYIYQINAERSVARNNGISAAKGRYICFLDSDDTYSQDVLEEFNKFLTDKSFPEALVFCDIELINDKTGNISRTSYSPVSEPFVNYVFSYAISTGQVCVASSLLKQEKFNPDIIIGEDRELWLRIVDKAQLFYLPCPGLRMLDHEERTVFLGNRQAVFGDLKSLRYSLYQHYAKKIAPETKRKVLSNAFAKIGYHYSYHKKNLKALKWFLRAFFKAPGFRTKERLFLIIDSSSIGRKLLRIFK